MTGADQIEARSIYGNKMHRLKVGSLLFLVNHLPYIKDPDDALKQRMRIINFPCSFTDDKVDLKKDPIKYKIKDDTLNELFGKDVCKIVMCNLMFEWVKLYKREGLLKTECINKATSNYLERDTLLHFINKFLDKKEKDEIPISDVINQFKNEVGIKNYSVKSFRDECVKNKLETTKRMLKGYKWKADREVLKDNND